MEGDDSGNSLALRFQNLAFSGRHWTVPSPQGRRWAGTSSVAFVPAKSGGVFPELTALA